MSKVKQRNEELSSMTVSDLQEELESVQAQYSKILFDHSSTGIEDNSQIKKLRKDIARINTFISSKAEA